MRISADAEEPEDPKKKKSNSMRKSRTTLTTQREKDPGLLERERLSVHQMHALKCFRPTEIFNINTNFNFVKKKKKDPALSDEDSEDDEQEIADLLKDDG